MPRPFRNRVFAALSGAWMLVALLEPLPLHVCPMHTGMVSAAGHAAPAPASGHAHHHAAAASGVTSGAGPASSHEDCKGCLCLGDCAGGTAVIVAPGNALAIQTTHFPDEAIAATPAFAPPVRGGLLLPFANGPPSRVVNRA